MGVCNGQLELEILTYELFECQLFTTLNWIATLVGNASGRHLIACQLSSCQTRPLEIHWQWITGYRLSWLESTGFMEIRHIWRPIRTGSLFTEVRSWRGQASNARVYNFRLIDLTVSISNGGSPLERVVCELPSMPPDVSQMSRF